MGTSSSFADLLTPSSRKSRKSRNSRRCARRKLELIPQCEQLEIKIAPAAIAPFIGSQAPAITQTVIPEVMTWTNAAGGDWDTASNWFNADLSDHHVPTASDDAVIDGGRAAPLRLTRLHGGCGEQLTSEAAIRLER